MSDRNIRRYTDALLLEREASVRTALEYLMVQEEEYIQAREERLKTVARTTARLRREIADRERRLAHADPELARLVGAPIESLRRTLEVLARYERACQATRAPGPVLAADERRAWADAALDGLLDVQDAENVEPLSP